MILATGTYTKPLSVNDRGFTLLEVMVVLFIIGISLSFIAINLSPQHVKVKEEGRRLAALINLAKDEAILSADEYALELEPDGYFFLAQGEKGWQEVEDDNVFRRRTFPDDMRAELTISNEAKTRPAWDAEAGQEPVLSRIYISPVGEVTPFVIKLAGPEQSDGVCLLTSGGPLGNVVITTEE